MNYSELKEIFWELKRNSPNDNLTAHIIFTDGSFAKEYKTRNLHEMLKWQIKYITFSYNNPPPSFGT